MSRLPLSLSHCESVANCQSLQLLDGHRTALSVVPSTTATQKVRCTFKTCIDFLCFDKFKTKQNRRQPVPECLQMRSKQNAVLDQFPLVCNSVNLALFSGVGIICSFTVNLICVMHNVGQLLWVGSPPKGCPFHHFTQIT